MKLQMCGRKLKDKAIDYMKAHAFKQHTGNPWHFLGTEKIRSKTIRFKKRTTDTHQYTYKREKEIFCREQDITIWRDVDTADWLRDKCNDIAWTRDGI